MKMIICLFFIFSFSAFSNPYFDPRKVESMPVDQLKSNYLGRSIKRINGLSVLRAEVAWSANETYVLTSTWRESSGTQALYNSSLKKDSLGSYKASLLVTTPEGEQTFHSSLGTGREFRRLVRTLAFRFPLPLNATSLKLTVFAENPMSGVLEKVLEKNINPNEITQVESQEIKITHLRHAFKKPALKFNFYAEGFDEGGEERFISAAKKAISALEQNLPGHEYFEFIAVFSHSNKKLGKAEDRGETIRIQDSFLGLYFPHWRKFGRWYHVVYPTSVTKYRNALAQSPYDYPLALVDDAGYWGVGNYKELTAIPVNNDQFSYLLLHEFGHFMGLNEEYEGGGPTELEFAEKIPEPWSQNITFNPDKEKIKWSKFLSPGIEVPTSRMEYNRYGGERVNPVGAYKGGYADSLPRGKSHKPVMKCTMSLGGGFCPVCKEAISTLIDFDRGKSL